MGAAIHTIPMGFDNVYVVKENGTILIDSGEPKKRKQFLSGLEKVDIKPEDIQLIILTHGHWDHIGSAADIKKITGAKVAMHKNEIKWLEESLKPMPPGVTLWGKIFTKLISWLLLPFVHINPTKVDIILEEGEFPLADYGISGNVIYTPGHSSGSVSILLETGEAFVGDLAMNKFPLRLSPGLPILAEDPAKLKESWQKLLEKNVKTIYPAHGEPFSVDIIRKEISNMSI